MIQPKQLIVAQNGCFGYLVKCSWDKVGKQQSNSGPFFILKKVGLNLRAVLFLFLCVIFAHLLVFFFSLNLHSRYHLWHLQTPCTFHSYDNSTIRFQTVVTVILSTVEISFCLPKLQPRHKVNVYISSLLLGS